MPDEFEFSKPRGGGGIEAKLKDLTPIPGYAVPVYNKSSFPQGHKSVHVAEVPYDPIGVMADVVSVTIAPGSHITSVGSANVLIMHGFSSSGKWVGYSGKSVEDLIDEVVASGLEVDALFVCNPGGHSLPRAEDGKHKYTYVTTDASGYMKLENDTLEVHFTDKTSGKNTNIKGKKPHIVITEEDLKPRIKVDYTDFEEDRVDTYTLDQAPEKVLAQYAVILLNEEKFKVV